MLLESEGFSSIPSFDILATARRLCGVRESALIDATGLTSRNDPSSGTFNPCHEIALIAIQGMPVIWTGTTDGLRLVAMGVSFIDYYARSRGVEPTYAAITQTPAPWDIDIRDDLWS